jgi:hypothetical protein
VTKCCQRCNRLDALLAPAPANAFSTWPAVTVTVEGSVIRRRDALSGEWQYGWRVRDAEPTGAAPAAAARGRATGPA